MIKQRKTDNRIYPERPIVGVGAVIFIGGAVLLIKRGRPPGYLKWSIPGGAVKLGETLQEAVQREVAEEVGLQVRAGRIVSVLDRIFPDEAGRIQYHYVLVDFLCQVLGGNLRPDSDVLEAGLVSLDDLTGYDLTAGTAELITRVASNQLEPYVSMFD
ncbi:MAG: NUDIX hydrolase [Deltaproteobacteria bacterium]|nr:NUDIX hydrolase [Deltaproteobacteria bacterium]